MPNAQTHLAVAIETLDNPTIREHLAWLNHPKIKSAYLLGNISPDVRVVSKQAREATHFFQIPSIDARRAQDNMLAAYPELNDVSSMRAEHAAFVAGYICHLIMDQTWVEMVVMPCLFLEDQSWGTGHPNWLTYSLLMTWMEYQAAPQVTADIVDSLSHTTPTGDWLPFTQDAHLIEWRDRITGFLRSGGSKVVSFMFAKTNDLTSDELEEIVLSEEKMTQQVYNIVSRDQLAAFRTETLLRMEQATLDYLTDFPYT